MTTLEAVLQPARTLGASALGRNVGLGLLLAVLLFLTAYPMGMLIYGSLHTTPPGEAGAFNLDGYRAMLSRQNGLVLLNTIGLSLVKTGLALVFALFLAWVVARTDTPYRDTLEVLVTLPFYIPPILTAMAWGMLATPKGGAINLAWTALTGSREPLVNVYSYGGVVWHMMQYSTPFLFLLLVSAFRSMDPTFTALQLAEGAFQPYGSLPNASRPVAPFKADGTRVPIYVIQYGILVNTEMVKPAEEPKSWQDLLDPRWKGKILSDDMRALGGGPSSSW